jgi:hypothetical protein
MAEKAGAESSKRNGGKGGYDADKNDEIDNNDNDNDNTDELMIPGRGGGYRQTGARTLRTQHAC